MGFKGRDRGIFGSTPSTKHVTLRGIDADTGDFFTFDGLDFRDEVTGHKLESRNISWQYGKMVDKRIRQGGREKHPVDLAYAFIGLATYDTEALGVQLRPCGSDPL